MTARAWESGQDHDGLLQGMREAEGSLDDYENGIVPLEEIEVVEKCPLCKKIVWPDEPTEWVGDDEDREPPQEVHKVCFLELRVKELERKLSELSYRVAV